MATNLKSVGSPDVLTENMLTIHQFLRESYEKARQGLQDGISFFKEELNMIQSKTRE